VQLLLGILVFSFLLGLGAKRLNPWLLGVLVSASFVATMLMWRFDRYM
jgi:hypothetical protein